MPTATRTRTPKLFIWQVQVQSYNKSGKKHNMIELYKYSQETEAKVQEYRYRQSHLVGHAVSWVHHRTQSKHQSSALLAFCGGIKRWTASHAENVLRVEHEQIGSIIDLDI